MTGLSTDRVRTWGLVWIDALTYAVALALVTSLGAVVVGFALGSGLSGAKYVLFFAGFVLLGYGTIRLWPRSPDDLDDTASSGVEGESLPETPDETRFQRFVQQLPPVRWVDSPTPERRMTPPGKLFLGSLLVLLTSFLLEAVFGF